MKRFNAILCVMLFSAHSSAAFAEDCTQVNASMESYMATVTYATEKGVKLEYNFLQLSQQWQRDHDYFTGNGSSDEAMYNQLAKDWDMLRAQSSDLLQLVKSAHQALASACSAAYTNPQCLGDPATTKANCDNAMQTTANAISNYEAIAPKYQTSWIPHTTGIGQVLEVSGRAIIVRGMRTHPVYNGTVALGGDVISVEEGAEITMHILGIGNMRIMENTKFEMPAPSPQPSESTLFWGGLWTTTKKLLGGESWEINTPAASVGVRG